MTREEYDWAMGRHSNIPDCCIEWFVNEDPNSRERSYKDRVILACCEYKITYWPCIKCLDSRNFVVPIHFCDDSCPKFRVTSHG